MPTLAMIHTSPLVIPVFSKLAAAKLPQVECFHMLDESLLKNTLKAGRLEPATTRRVASMTSLAGEAGADVVLVTCSSIGPAVDVARQVVAFPVVRVDEAMADAAVAQGGRIGVAATLRSTLEPTVSLIEARARLMGIEREVEPQLCEGAFEAASAGDAERHDQLVERGLLELAGGVDVIVLAQASMARVVAALPPGRISVPILSSPESAIERAAEALRSLAAG
ncbi:MAG: Asp/Glu/hydantoin racemase [Acidobacteria bacterium]|nr:Asp/Glu/hydantoin racemase [Acidobacteriota bacterium]